jgi:hypothetical protein
MTPAEKDIAAHAADMGLITSRELIDITLYTGAEHLCKRILRLTKGRDHGERLRAWKEYASGRLRVPIGVLFAPDERDTCHHRGGLEP